MTADRLLRAKQVAELLGVSKVTVMRMGLRGDLDRVHITGRCVGYKLSQVNRFITTGSVPVEGIELDEVKE